MNILIIFFLTLGDSLFGCLQVSNITAGRRMEALFTSFSISICKILSTLLVVKSTSYAAVIAYVAGGAIGAQLSLIRRQQSRQQSQ